MILTDEELKNLIYLIHRQYHLWGRYSTDYGYTYLECGNTLAVFNIYCSNSFQHLTIRKKGFWKRIFSGATCVGRKDDGPWWDDVRTEIPLLEKRIVVEEDRRAVKEQQRIENLRKDYAKST